MNLALQVTFVQISVWNALQPAEKAAQIKIKCKIVHWICDFQVFLHFSTIRGIVIRTKTTELPQAEKLTLCFCLCLPENFLDFHLGSDNSAFESSYLLWVRWEPFFTLCLKTLQTTNSCSFSIFLKVSALKNKLRRTCLLHEEAKCKAWNCFSYSGVNQNQLTGVTWWYQIYL